MEKEVKIAVLGLGVVANGLVKNLEAAQEKIRQQTGLSFSIAKVLVRSKENKQVQAKKQQLSLTTDIAEILDDPNIDIVVELIGGVDSAKKWITQALQQKKHVVTANKDLIAQFGNELTAIAKENDVSLFYEASVAGGIPILQNLNSSFMVDEITGIQGVLNGTTNFMLTQMAESRISYTEALKAAQASGFAEADPSNDVDGWDAVYKLIILVRLALGRDLSLSDVQMNGIRAITQADIFYAQKFGYQVKLVAQAEKMAEKIYAAVSPVLIPQSHPLAFVKNEMNGVFITSEAIGSSMLYGPGAGAMPTAASVLTDIVKITQNEMSDLPALQMSRADLPKGESYKEVVASYYFLLSDCSVDIFTFLKKQQIEPIRLEQQQENGEIAFITGRLTLEQKNSLLEQLRQVSHIKQILNVWGK
ncbi:MAG: homoserine dehydrogenase [Tetragenococcus sp.]|nr:homoserine dehydrogenase [Tetragenococcus sp.]